MRACGVYEWAHTCVWYVGVGARARGVVGRGARMECGGGYACRVGGQCTMYH